MAKGRRFAEYSAAPLRSGRARRRPWLRTAQLNAVGWSVLLGACLVFAALGIVVARAVGPAGWAGAGLGLVPVLAIVVADRRRWGADESSHCWGASPAEVAHIAAGLRAAGVQAQVRLDEGDPSGAACLVHRRRDSRAVSAALRASGVPVPPEFD